MKAVRLYAPGDIRVEDIPKPSPESGEVLLKVMACGVCGSDIPRATKYGAHNAPLTLGHEFAGEIVELGTDVHDFKVHDKVTAAPLIPCETCKYCQSGNYSLCESYSYFGSRRDGAFAEYVAVPTNNLLRIPDSVDFIDAATCDPCANAVHALLLADIKGDEILCVYGSGPIGLYAAACAKLMGIREVIAIDLDDRKLEIAKQYGADHVINSMTSDPVETVRKLTGGEGADIVIDFTGSPDAQAQGLACTAKLGRFIIVGISHQGLSIDSKTVDRIMRGQITIQGSWNSFSKPFPGIEWTQSLAWFGEGRLTSKPMISHKLTLDEAPAFFRDLAQGKVFFNKIMFLPHGAI